MKQSHSDLKFNVWHSPEGALTENPGYSIGLECIFPGDRETAPNNVALCIELANLATVPKLMADVVWGHPSGHEEFSSPENWNSVDDWQVATPEAVDELVNALPQLIRSFGAAVLRGKPQFPSIIDFKVMTTNERLFSAGLMPEWDAATKARNREKMIEILCRVGLRDQADEIAGRVLTDPKRHGL